MKSSALSSTLAIRRRLKSRIRYSSYRMLATIARWAVAASKQVLETQSTNFSLFVFTFPSSVDVGVPSVGESAARVARQGVLTGEASLRLELAQRATAPRNLCPARARTLLPARGHLAAGGAATSHGGVASREERFDG